VVFSAAFDDLAPCRQRERSECGGALTARCGSSSAANCAGYRAMGDGPDGARNVAAP
jgi:hypothetical protein